MNRSILEQPFEGHLIKSRRGPAGKSFNYVEGSEFIRRLNEAFDGRWSFEIAEYQIHDAEVIVLGKLVAGDVTKTAFGGSTITKSSQTSEPINLADDLKAAATDALKKAASMLGVGLHLHTDQEPIRKSPILTKGNGRSRRLTDRQRSAMMAIGKKLKLTKEELTTRSTERFGVPPFELSRADASTFISSLLEQSTAKKSA